MLLLVFIVICLHSTRAYIEFQIPKNNVFDTELYEKVLDNELCEEQLLYIRRDNRRLLAQFLDAGLKIPRGLLKGNLVDLGNYHQCLGITGSFAPSDIEGKYCMLNFPFTQNDLELPSLPEWPDVWPTLSKEGPEFKWPELLPNTRQHKDLLLDLKDVRATLSKYSHLIGPDMDNLDLFRVAEENDLAGQSVHLAVCVPKTCTPKQFIDTILLNTTGYGLNFTQEFCRLNNDKPFVPGDYAAMAVFGLIFLLTALCTGYDLYYTHILKGDPKKASTLGKSFSVYTNTRRLVTYNPAPGALECIDGIRALAMMWVIVGHTFSSNVNSPFYNEVDFYSWMTSLSAIWILAAANTVDTFFLLSGILIVYTSVGKFSKTRFIKNIHLFYLHRILRMFPVLATGVFLQATLFNHLSDGPRWNTYAHKVHKCRKNWWSTLIHGQNYLNPANTCISPSWYLAVDTQLHILSPIVLFWVVGGKRSAWLALSLAMAIVMIVTSTFNALNEFQPAPNIPSGTLETSQHYLKYYYVNTLTRCTPFFVGMLFGYLIFIFKGRKVHMPKWLVALGWICTFVVLTLIIYSAYPIFQLDWDSPFWNNVINSYSRAAWAACLGWMIFACTYGYGGPVNWFLSLRMWKVPARISYAMYIFHYAIISAVNASAVQPTEFTAIRYFFRFLADFTSALVIGFVVTVMIDAPFSTLIKLAIGGGPKRPRPKKEEDLQEDEICGAKENVGAIDSTTSPENDISKTKC